MIRVGTVIAQLASAELANNSKFTLHEVIKGTVDIHTLKSNVGIINEAILDLHKRFKIKEHRLVLTPEKNKTVYRLLKSYPYVNLLTNPEDRDMLQILQVIDWNGNVCPSNVSFLNYNTNATCVPVRIVDYNAVEIPVEVACPKNKFTVIYTPRPALFNCEINNNAEFKSKLYQEILDTILDIPDAYIQALVFRVGSRMRTTTDAQPYGQTAAMAFHRQYEEECARLLALGHQIHTAVDTIGMFNQKGFV